MIRRVSVVTMDDLSTYFSGSIFRDSRNSDSRLQARSKQVSVDISLSDVQYEVKTEAVDDPSDTSEITTEDPIAAIDEVLKEDMPVLATTPSGLSKYLVSLASDTSSQSITRKLRRVCALLRTAELPTIPSSTEDDDFSDPPDEDREYPVKPPKPLSHAVRKSLAKLQQDIKKKGWSIESKRDKTGYDQLIVNIPDDTDPIFIATVSVESINWEYIFQVTDHPDLLEEGYTDDPIREFKKYLGRKDVDQGMKEVAEAIKAGQL